MGEVGWGGGGCFEGGGRGGRIEEGGCVGGGHLEIHDDIHNTDFYYVIGRYLTWSF